MGENHNYESNLALIDRVKNLVNSEEENAAELVDLLAKKINNSM